MIFLVFLLVFIVVILLNQLSIGWSYNKVCLVGKTAIITGGNSGIGYKIALSLASRGCKIIIADKNEEVTVRDKIFNETDNNNITIKKMDLSSFKSVRDFVDFIKKTEDKIDILINNAGTGASSLTFTEDGLQTTLQVNYFGHFLLTYLLIDHLKKSPGGRVIFTSSTGAFGTVMSLNDLTPGKEYCFPARCYLNSKLCQALAAKCFGEKLKDTKVVVNSCHPGAARTKIFLEAYKETSSIWPIILGLSTIPFGRSPEAAAQTALHLACDKKIANVTGKFFMDCREFFMPIQVYNKKFREKVFEHTKKLVKLTPEECTI